MRAPGSPPRRIHVWAPGVIPSTGGIQTFSARLVAALEQLCPETSIDVYSKNDPSPAQGGRPTLHPYGGWPQLVRTPVFAGAVFAAGARLRPDLVITTHLHFAPAAAWLRRVSGVPYWAVAHGVEAWGELRPALRSGLAAAERVLAVSNHTRGRLLQEQGLGEQQVGLLPNTLDESAFSIGGRPGYLLRRYGIDPGSKILLTVARLVSSEQYKGYDRVLRALPRILGEVPNAHYIIAGQGSDRERVERMVAELGVGDRVTLTGFVPETELCDHYNLCDVFAMPSKREGFGIVYLEAMACGKPVLGGNKDGAVDALRGGDLGALVDPDDVEAIASTLTSLLRGTHPNGRLVQPQAIRDGMLAEFGMARFQERVRAHLCDGPARAHLSACGGPSAAGAPRQAVS